MIHVYMDDVRRCPKGFTLVRSVDECIELLRVMEVDILSLDHDMGPGEKTGTEVATAIAQEGLYAREIYLHTSSIYGMKAMYEILYQNKPEHVVLHNGPIPFERLDEIAHAAKKTSGNKVNK
ncbi:cell division protein FtsJ [Paenibacillus anaericanus]|uniref:Cell division protein FtsJ n=1 Tax=Paenibacillus anaericanus TaxID=170367 RepID=A0A433YE47_9BACL|nr:cell division protein FtsJ [Paenibacillus anaericanus]